MREEVLQELLLNNERRIHTTKLGMQRIKRNLGLYTTTPVAWCINAIKNDYKRVYTSGKNIYVVVTNAVITINRGNFCIITAHKLDSRVPVKQ